MTSASWAATVASSGRRPRLRDGCHAPPEPRARPGDGGAAPGYPAAPRRTHRPRRLPAGRWWSGPWPPSGARSSRRSRLSSRRRVSSRSSSMRGSGSGAIDRAAVVMGSGLAAANLDGLAEVVGGDPAGGIVAAAVSADDEGAGLFSACRSSALQHPVSGRLHVAWRLWPRRTHAVVVGHVRVLGLLGRVPWRFAWRRLLVLRLGGRRGLGGQQGVPGALPFAAALIVERHFS